MKKFSIILAAIVFIAVLEINAQNSTDTGIKFEHTSWTEIVRKAKAENKLIFLDAYASWCGPCKYMSKNIFTNEEVAGYYNQNFINAKIDMEKGEGIEIAKKYNVKAYPTFLFIDGNGNLLHQACGGKEVADFIKVGETALEDHLNTSAFIKKYKNSIDNTDYFDPAFVLEYFTVLSQACISTSADLDDYFNKLSEKNYLMPDNITLLFSFVKEYENAGFQYLVKNQKRFSEMYDNTGENLSEEKIQNKIKQVYSYSIKKVSRKKDRNAFDKIQREIKASSLSFKDELILNSDMAWYNYQKNWEKYSNAAVLYVPKYAMENYRELNSIGWTFYENVEDKEALSLATEWVRASLDLKTEYSNMDTLAALLFKLGIKDEALEAANKAIKLAEEEEADAEETYSLIEKIEALN